MKADFLDAHQRHWDDAEHLFAAGRWANADHLYGVAAECGLKRLMLQFGMSWDQTKDWPADRDNRVHADGIWARYESYRQGNVTGASYGLPIANPFANWDVSDRYAHQNQFAEPYAQAHKHGARLVCDLIAKARREGLLP